MNPTSTRPHLAVPARHGAWVRWFRVGVAGAVLWQTLEQWLHPGWKRLFVDPALRVPMPGLAWMQLHGVWPLRALFATICLSALTSLLGRGGRVAPLAMAGGMLALFAQDASLYLNHHYLMVVLSLTVALLPQLRPRDPAPADALFLIRCTLVIPYVFAAVAKFDPDWLTGRVMANMLIAREPTFGAWVTLPGQVIWMTYGAILLDGLAPLALWWGRGAVFAWLAVCGFHLANSGLYDIGVFPWLMLALTPILLPHDTWPRMSQALRTGTARHRLAMIAPALMFVGVSLLWTRQPHVVKSTMAAWAGLVLGWLAIRPWVAVAPSPVVFVRRSLPRALVAAWIVVHLLVPFRHLAIPGDVTWTEQGHRYAWRMLLRTKRIERAVVEITDPSTGRRWLMRPNQLLEPFQTTDILGRPDLAWSFARVVKQHFADAGRPGVEVRLRVAASLNGRPATLLYDPEVDVASAPLPTWERIPWVMPTPRTMWW